MKYGRILFQRQRKNMMFLLTSFALRVKNKYHVEIRGEYVPFSLMEGQEKVAHQLTREEQMQLANYEKGKAIIGRI